MGHRLSTGRELRSLFHRAIALVEKSYPDRSFTVADAARELLASKRQLQRALAFSGTSFSECLLETRMERAQQMLEARDSTRSGKEPIDEIARAVGYSSGSSFAKAYRRFYAVPPRRAREARKARADREAEEMTLAMSGRGQALRAALRDVLSEDEVRSIKRLAAVWGARNLRVVASHRGSRADSGHPVFLVDLDAGRNLFDLLMLTKELADTFDLEVDFLTEKGFLPYQRDEAMAEAVAL